MLIDGIKTVHINCPNCMAGMDFHPSAIPLGTVKNLSCSKCGYGLPADAIIVAQIYNLAAMLVDRIYEQNDFVIFE